MKILSLKPLLFVFLLHFALYDAIATEDPENVPSKTEIVENLGKEIDPNVRFIDSDGNEKSLKDIANGKPIIITPVYYRCPRLCNLVLNGLLDTLKELDLELGTDYKVASISFNPREKAKLAATKKQNYLKELDEAKNSDENNKQLHQAGWHFFTGKQENITKTMSQLGFNYEEDQGEFLHSAAIMILSPDFKITRYLYGITYNPQITRLSLVEASQGKIGNTIDKVLLYCFRFDPTKGKYSLAIMNITRLISICVLAILVLSLVIMRRKEILVKRKNSLD